MCPIYEYKCNECGNVFDELVRKSDDEPSFCKYCASCQIERTVTAHGGYNFDSGSASVRPKGAGSFKK